MYKNMLVPLDGSELAEVVFTYAKEFAARFDLKVVLLFVSPPRQSEFVPMHRSYIEHAAEIVSSQTHEVQKRIGIKEGGKVVEARGELVTGYPPEEILRYAEKNDIDLILMATHGRSGIKRWTMGSVADKVLRSSKVPVLLVRAGIPDEIVYDKWPRRTILAPLDGSEMAGLALAHVEALAKQRGTELVDVVLLSVCEPPSLPHYSMSEVSDIPLNWGQYEQQEVARSKHMAGEYLAGVEKRLKESNISVRSEILVGRANEEIVNFANKNPFNMIVMATHGRAGLSRWVYGSIAEYVLLGVSSPVLLVRPH
ncbi:universal stress protein [Chloroflexota bacterium]